MRLFTITAIICLLCSIDLLAQSSQSEKTETREEKKELNKIIREAALTEYANLARTKQWAIQADMITIPSGGIPYPYQPNSRLNFLTLDEDNVILQIVLDEFYNSNDRNVRRWRDRSCSAKIENYTVSQTKKGVRISMKRDAGYCPNKYYIFVNSAGVAQVNFGEWGGGMQITGKFVPLHEADIFLREFKKEF